MKVLVAAAQFSSQLSGIQRHALMLVRALLLQPEITHIDLLVAPWQQELFQPAAQAAGGRVQLRVAQMSRGIGSRNHWYYRALPQTVEQLRPDIVHLTYPVPVDRARIAAPVVLTLHDMYPYDVPENFGFPKALFHRLVLQQCMREVDAIACVSGATLGRMRQLVSPTVAGRAVRIFNAVEPSPEWSDSSPIAGWRGEPFLLTVAQHRANKNIQLTLQAFHGLLARGQLHAASRLLVIGIAGPETRAIERAVRKRALSDRVVFLRGISEEQLQWCYRHCELALAPSSVEGFGLPVAEAMMAGCRMVCSDTPAFRELDAGLCTFFSLQSSPAESLRRAILLALEQPHPAPHRFPQLMPAAIGAEYHALYSGLLRRSPQQAFSPGVPAFPPVATPPVPTPSVARGWRR